jgi:hypothetical protein
LSTLANPLRGEVALALAGGTLVLRPSFAALVAAEGELGSLFAVLERAGAGDVRLGEMAVLFWHCAGAAGMSREGFEAALLEAGPARLLAPYRALLAAIFGG